MAATVTDRMVISLVLVLLRERIQMRDIEQFQAAGVLSSRARVHSQERMRVGCLETRGSPAGRVGLGFLEWLQSLPTS